MSPEAPVPVVLVEREKRMLGGAANVAANIRSLGSNVLLFGKKGRDYAAAEIENLLTVDGIESHLLESAAPTILKQRYVADGHHVVRIDTEEKENLSPAEEVCVLKELRELLPTLAAIAIADYAKGYFTESMVNQVLTLAREAHIPCVVDTKPENISFYKRASLITPNEKEALEAAQVVDVLRAGNKLMEQVEGPVLVTRGSSGMTLFSGENPVHLEATARNIVDVSGAGDTVVSVATVMLAAGASLLEAAVVANDAAGKVVAKEGTATVSLEELYGYKD